MSAKTATKEFVATGRRKTSTARVRIQEGTGTFTINNRPHNEYCTTDQQRKMVIAPLSTAEKSGAVDVSVNVSGGGGTGQAGAIRHGLSRALEKMDGELRSPLKKSRPPATRSAQKRKKENRTTGGSKEVPILQKIRTLISLLIRTPRPFQRGVCCF